MPKKKKKKNKKKKKKKKKSSVEGFLSLRLTGNTFCGENSTRTCSSIVIVVEIIFMCFVLGGIVLHFVLTLEPLLSAYTLFLFVMLLADFLVFFLSVFIFTSTIAVCLRYYKTAMIFGLIYFIINILLCFLLFGFGIYYVVAGASYLWSITLNNRAIETQDQYWHVKYKIYQAFLIWGIIFLVVSVLIFVFNLFVGMMVFMSFVQLKFGNKPKSKEEKEKEKEKETENDDEAKSKIRKRVDDEDVQYIDEKDLGNLNLDNFDEIVYEIEEESEPNLSNDDKYDDDDDDTDTDTSDYDSELD